VDSCSHGLITLQLIFSIIAFAVVAEYDGYDSKINYMVRVVVVVMAHEHMMLMTNRCTREYACAVLSITHVCVYL
jgi:hypothetical protein